MPPFLFPVSIAPMMDRTDRHYRYLMRQMTRRTLLYTEMVVAAAILHGDRAKLLGFSPEEKPLALQVGGDNPQDLSICARIAEEMGYDEINLNVGCPSDRVKSGNFGACLMAQPDRVARAVEAMQKATTLPVTVKHRIGIDERDRYEDMKNFVRIVSDAGCQRFTVHARKAWLKGLSPKENRTVPPLRYGDVHRLKEEFPHLTIEINGGIITLEQVREQLQSVDAVMIGRAAYDTPYLFAAVDRDFYGETEPPPSRHAVVEAMFPYIEYWVSRGVKLNAIARPMLQLFAGQPGTKAWKRHISENAHLPNAGVDTIRDALAKVP
ncbi:tRNA dihydrouridine(20/20a) synthase DusA [Lusitaniella coriacea LEGE 07157]|uniref:tRNA-dihydrouridine(20/20a) synthase n=1 Tax=Lusitaniella coriacea LEGE 07157 TaxID=945747 RepID=A0A8J7DXW5_9CYAN|nr:tRNA dihydrouridine(20/20a) synthase DusA [Lusitaniella coriacea LEGE 07157]